MNSNDNSFDWTMNSNSYITLDSGFSPSVLLHSPLYSSFTEMQNEESSTEIQPREQYPVFQNTDSVPPPSSQIGFSKPIQQRRSEDGYQWRKYGQKQVKGSENPRSYYKCSYPNCSTKKKVEQDFNGHVTQIIYKGTHNHPKPRSTERNLTNWLQNNGEIDSVMKTGQENVNLREEEEDDCSEERRVKRRKGEYEDEDGGLGLGNRTIRDAQLVVHTISEIDFLDDGFKWRKYGQKAVKGNLNPRSYYKCTYNECPVRKHVERSPQDLKSVITTYEGKHNHDVPALKGSTIYGTKRPFQSIGSRDLLTQENINREIYTSNNSIREMTHITEIIEPVHGYGSSAGVYANQMRQTEIALSFIKEEPMNESTFNPFLND